MSRSHDPSASLLTPLQWLFGLQRPPLSRLGAALLVTGLLVLFVAFMQSFVDVLEYGGVDLRPKVVGARCLWTGRDPYTYEWQPGEPDTFLDPVKRSPGLSRASFPPTVLLFYSPLAWLPYGTQRLMWFVCEWAALVTSIALLARVVGRQRRLLFVVLALLFFAAGSFWRMHVERGQYYVFVLLAFAAGAFLLVARHQAGWLPGMLLGLGVALRPTMLIVPALLFVAGRLRLGLSAALTALVCVALTLPLGGTRVWQSYLDVVDGWSRMFTDVHYQDKRFGPRNPVPATVEGVELTAALPDNSSNTTLHAVYRMAVGDVGDQGIDIHLVARVCMLGTWTIGLAWLAMRRRHLTARSAFAAAMVVGLLGEFFVPSRVGYADVLYLLPLALLMRSLFPETVPGGAAVALLLGLTAGQLGLLGSGVSTWLRWVLVIGALTAAAFRPRHRPTIGMPAKAAAPVS